MNYLLLNSILLGKFLNKFMKRGQKTKIEQVLFRVLMWLNRSSKVPGIFLFFEIFERLKPLLSLTPTTVKKKKVFIPVLIRPYKRYLLAIQWFYSDVNASQKIELNKRLVRVVKKYFFDNRFIRMKKKSYYSQVFENRQYRHYRWN